MGSCFSSATPPTRRGGCSVADQRVAVALQPRRQPAPERPWVAPVSAALVAAAGCAYLATHDPGDPDTLMPQCPTKMLTGLDCPACGGLRMVRALLTGQWSAAVHDNLLLVLLLPVVIVVWGRWLVAATTGGSYQPRVSRRVGYALLAVAVVWMVLRNIP